MFGKFLYIVFGLALAAGLSLILIAGTGGEKIKKGEKIMPKIIKKDEEWKQQLTPEQYKVMREGATERAFTGKYDKYFENGVYRCPGCGTALFSSKTKYDHGTGWPSFTDPVDENNIAFIEDKSYGMDRVEVRCAVCGAHLGHVFDDGPGPNGKHYCINSASLDFKAGQDIAAVKEVKTEKADFAAGCFWGVEHKFRKIKGVRETMVGYTGGTSKNPTYGDVSGGDTGHAESVEILFDPSIVSYEELVRAFFDLHNPTTVDRQGPDFGNQYRSAIFYNSDEQKAAAEKIKSELGRSGKYKDKIVTEIVPAGPFYKAEEYHQRYLEKKGRQSCGF